MEVQWREIHGLVLLFLCDNMNSRLIECVLFSGFEVFFNISAK